MLNGSQPHWPAPRLVAAVLSQAFSEPALFALTVPPAEATARAAGRRIGMAEVEVLTEQVTYLRTRECRYGSGRVREQLVQLLHHEANELLHGAYSEKTGKALLTATTHLLGRDLEQATAHGRDALRTLQREVRPLQSASPHLADLDKRVTDFRTRTTRRHQQDNDL